MRQIDLGKQKSMLVQRWKQDTLERVSISIAVGNYNMLRGNRTLPAV